VNVSAVVANPPPMIPVYCPECAKRGIKRMLLRAAPGAMVEAFCRDCRFRKVIIV
jgi:hypothetical protein